MTPLRPYENESPAPISRRFFAFFIDFVLLVALHIGLFFLGNVFVSMTPSYQEGYSRLDEARIACYRLQEESHVSTFPEEGEKRYENPKSQEDRFLLWLHSHIVYSFQEDSAPFEEKGISSLPFSETQATYESDDLAYFYVCFAAEKNEDYHLFDLQEETYPQHYYHILKSKTYSYANESLWDYDEVAYSLPALKSKFAAEAYYYLSVEGKYQAGLSIYNLLAKSYQDIWDQEVAILTTSSVYQGHWDVYLSNYRLLSMWIDLSCLLSYALSFLLYLVPQFFPKHQTLGKKIIKIQSVDVDGYPLSHWQIAVRNLLKFLAYFSFTLLSNLLVAGANSAWVYPIFALGSLPVSLLSISIVLLIFLFASFLLSLFNHRKQGLADLASHSYQIDLRYYLPPEERVEEKTETVETVPFEVVDSTTIRRD